MCAVYEIVPDTGFRGGVIQMCAVDILVCVYFEALLPMKKSKSYN